MEAHLYSIRLCVVDIRFGSPPCCKNQLYWDRAHSLHVLINCERGGQQKDKENYIVMHRYEGTSQIIGLWSYY